MIGWNALFIENHDIPRVASKWGDDEYIGGKAVPHWVYVLFKARYTIHISRTRTWYDQCEI